MLLMLLAKAPPPTPESIAHAMRALKGQSLSERTIPAMTMGMQRRIEVE